MRLPRLPSCLPAAGCALLLCACGEQPDPFASPPRDQDPLMAALLAGPVMMDPDLVDRNTANQLASFAPLDASLPVPDDGPASIAAARDEAARLVGGHAALLDSRPPPTAADEPSGEAGGEGGEAFNRCARLATASFVWAARMPATFPVYPRAAVQDALGADLAGCGLRAINFSTPVDPEEVLDFYFTRARRAGFTVHRARSGGEDILQGSRGPLSFRVVVGRDGEGFTEIDLLTLAGAG